MNTRMAVLAAVATFVAATPSWSATSSSSLLTKAKAGDSWLGKAEALLGNVVHEAPGGTAPNAAQGSAAQNTAGHASAPAQNNAATGAGSTLVTEARQLAAQKLGLSGLENACEKVTAARQLLGTGNTAKAKNLLDEIPSAASALRGLRL